MQDGNESKKAGDGDGDEKRGNVTKFTTTTMGGGGSAERGTEPGSTFGRRPSFKSSARPAPPTDPPPPPPPSDASFDFLSQQDKLQQDLAAMTMKNKSARATSHARANLAQRERADQKRVIDGRVSANRKKLEEDEEAWFRFLVEQREREAREDEERRKRERDQAARGKTPEQRAAEARARQQRDEERRRSARHLARANVVLTLADQSLTPHSLSLSLCLCAYQLNCRHPNRTASAAVVGGQWKDYEERWAAFGDSGVVTMASIPWPPHADRLLQWQIQKIPPGQDRKATVRSAYKKCALRWHPDKFMGKHGGKMSDGEKDAIQARLNDNFQALNASFTAALKGL